MDHTPKKVFILENNEYVEITFQELYQRRKNDSTFRDRKFLFEDGFLMEARPNEFEVFRKEKRRQRYQNERAAKNKDISLDALPEEMLSSVSFNSEQDLSEIVEKRIMSDTLAKALMRLPEKDQLLIYQHHFAGISMTELAKMNGVSQQAISRRIGRIYSKLKVMIE